MNRCFCKWIVTLLFWLCAASLHASPYTVRDAFDELDRFSEDPQSEYQMIGFLSNVLLHLELDQPTGAFFEFLEESLRHFNLQELYRSSHFSDKADEWRTVTFHGRNFPDRYTIRLDNQEPYDQGALSHLGDVGAEFGLRPKISATTNEKSFEATAAARLAMKQFTHKAVAAWIYGMCKVIDPGNIDRLISPQSDLLREIKGVSRKPLDDYIDVFPYQMRFVDRYMIFKSFIAPRTHNNQQYTRLEFKVSPRVSAYKDDFHLIYNYFKKVKGVLWLSVALQTEDGLNVTSFELDTRTHSFSWTLNTRKGLLIPSTATGEPVFSRAFSLEEIDQYRLNAIIRAKISIIGVHVDTGPSVTRIDYRKMGQGADFTFQLLELPTPEITGRALGFVPLFLVDVIIPSNIQELAKQFVDVMAHGNDGRGSSIKMRWDESRPMNAEIRLKGYTELLDNRFVNVALRLMSKRIQPNPETLTEIRRFWGLWIQKMLPQGGDPSLLPKENSKPAFP